MKIIYKKTPYGLKPCMDEDLEKERKLTNGKIYSCDVKTYRNYEFHKKYFALIKATWEVMTDEMKDHYKDSENLRKTIEIAAGHCDTLWSIKRGEFIEVPKSIAFDKMDEYEFQDLYDSVYKVIFGYVLKGRISEQDFNEELINF